MKYIKNLLRPAQISILIAFLLAAVTVSPALAARPMSIHIEVLDVIGGSGEPFTASGPAVNSGQVCANGTVDDLSVVPHGSPSAPFRTLHVHKRFYCEDGSGTFDIRMIVRLDNTTLETTARWRVSSGSGDYTRLRGNGALAGTPINPGVTIFDVYDGRVH